MTLIILILLGVLACFILWLIGLCFEEKCLHRDFQANTVRHKRVLPLIYLALEGIREGYLKYISEADFEDLKKKGLHD